MNTPLHIHSRDNALFKDLRRLAQGNTAYRKQERVWAEGDHLLRAALARGIHPGIGVFAESAWPQLAQQWGRAAPKTVVLGDALYAELSTLESSASMGFVFDLSAPAALSPNCATVILDQVQDAGNVGAILRSAAAFGFGQVAALRGTAALWGPKVLRAGMGAHWALQLHEGLEVADLQDLQVPVLLTSSHQGDLLHQLGAAQLAMPCAWAFGHEGQGVGEALQALATRCVRIAQPGGEESLNVAMAAAICLHASATAAPRQMQPV